MKFLLGKKIGMTTLFDEAGSALNVTLLACQGNEVTLHRTREKDGYVALQVALPKTKSRTLNKEFRVDGVVELEGETKLLEQFPIGTQLMVNQFTEGDLVQVTGITKAKGFQGVVKRHGFKGQMTSHGRKHDIRKPGSIGATFPEHVIKGRRMAGRMGADRFTVRNLRVVFIDEEQGILAVKGAVPGVAGRVVEIKSVK
ncbi:MAG: 50S ribosomal protein L3 [Candidatus Moraniibacteriota bacterium]|nr:MAG: 50S ribosomal protein L3 [Candidatus Moranbacteria bacterium]